MRLKSNQFASRHSLTGNISPAQALRSRPGTAAFTLIEVVIAAAIVGLIFGGIINSYIQAGQRIEWTGYSLAAQSLGTEVLEQVKAASWDPAQANPVNNLTNMNLLSPAYNSTTKTYTGYTTGILDIPYSSTNYVQATMYVSIQMINVTVNVQMQTVRVDTVWPFGLRGNKLFTNTVCTMVAPDNRAPNTF